MDNRVRAVEKFFRRIERIALFGADGQVLKEKKKEKQVEGKIVLLRQQLDTCPMCGSTADFKTEKNFEYPDGIYVGCNKCGVRTSQFVEFADMVEGRSSYSLLRSYQTALEAWNTRL